MPPTPPPHLVRPDGVRAVVDVELVVAIDGETLEPDHEALQDGLQEKERKKGVGGRVN